MQHDVLAFDRDGFWLDLTEAHVPWPLPEALLARAHAALRAMTELEAGAIANPDEHRRVGHYWLRNPAIAPEPELAQAITQTQAQITAFAQQIHSGALAPATQPRFTRLLLIGIGGSALGPQLVADALSQGPADRLRFYSLDNTDPRGIDRVLAALGAELAQTLTLVISKSGGTAETRNAMLAVERAYESLGLAMGAHAVAITQEQSALDQHAIAHQWLARFPMWDWVGGRTSVLSAVGLLPAALQGIDTHALIAGAARMDEITRNDSPRDNPAMRLALAWHHLTDGKGTKSMVVLPYRDQLGLLSRYLQQLVMESLGKTLDLDGNTVHQGLSVYGNKGSTDQHAYVQQLRDGLDNFFVVFVETLDDLQDKVHPVAAPDVTAGDYLFGFLEGTRSALSAQGRHSLTITTAKLDAHALGMLIALFERTVGLYAHLIHVNAYHQPGVEAGKRAAGEVLKTQRRVIDALREKNTSVSSRELADALGEDPGTVWRILRRLAANPERKVVATEPAGMDTRYAPGDVAG
ncbi:MAG: glucose-6-phosphate isomerase [Deltaproteobacteria bacterium]|nr:glucose-6-phosphate isomerase [Deltaproteobacteria bacterium]